MQQLSCFLGTVYLQSKAVQILTNLELVHLFVIYVCCESGLL